MVTVQISILAINSPNGGGNMGCFGKCGFPWFWGCRRKEKSDANDELPWTNGQQKQ